MWGQIDTAPSGLVPLHLELNNQLADLSWTRSQVWNGRASVFEWQMPGDGPRLAFDVVPQDGALKITLVVREATWVSSVQRALNLEGVSATQHGTRTERFNLQDAPVLDNADPNRSYGEVAKYLRTLRQQIESATIMPRHEIDPVNQIEISYSVKPEKDSCRSLVFLFTSIRKKQHWLDFGGPHGKSMQVNPARVVFVHDTYASDYTYHLAHAGSFDVYDATARFIRAYVEREGYAWESVVLAGLSKGGTAALALGASLPACTVVTVAPQLDPGTYLAEKHPRVLASMFTTTDPDPATQLTQMFWDKLTTSASEGPIRNCFILTSSNDPNCTDGLSKLAEVLPKTSRLSVRIDRNPSMFDHLQTVRRHSSRFLALLGGIAQGITPDDIAQEHPVVPPALRP